MTEAERSGVRNEMLHPATEEVEAYVAGSLSAADRATLESHLAGCPECTAEVEEWRALFAGLAALPQIEPSPGFADRVMAQVRVRQPWHVRIVIMLRRFLPSTTGGWLLATAILALPVLTMGGALTWLISRPWLSLGDLWTYLGFRAEEFMTAIVRRVAIMILENQTSLSILEWVHQTMTAIGAPGVGIAALIGAVVMTLSVWTLYQNLFRDSTRGGSHATT